MRICATCEATLPVDEIPEKGAQCKTCDNTVESLQRMLRKEWGKGYASKYKKTKADKANMETDRGDPEDGASAWSS